MTATPIGRLGSVLGTRPGSAVTRRALLIGYAATFLLFTVLVGLPTERTALLAWLLGALALSCVGRGVRAMGRMIADWLPFAAILVAWDLTRGLADSLGIPVHISDLAALEADLFGGSIPTVWLQEHLHPAAGQWAATGPGAWFDVAVTMIYTSHFLVTPIVAALLWLRHRERWLSFITHVLALAGLALATYILLPAAPPWYAAREGVIGPVQRLSGLGWDALGLHRAGALLETGQAKVNLVAALPSLHTGYAVLVLVFFWPTLTRLGRVLLSAYPLAMGFVLVYAGEHYVVDVTMGAIYAVTAGIVALGVSRLRCRQRSRSDPLDPRAVAD